MKKWVNLGVGLGVLGVFGGLVWAGSSGKLADVPFLGQMFAGEAPVKQIHIPAGTPLKLILRETLDAGGSKEKDRVDLILAEDVSIGGVVVIPRGAMATGVVTKSRGASLLSSVSNRPARLEITLESIRFGKNFIVKIAPKEAGKEGQYIFTQANTADRIDSAKIDRLWEDEKSREAMATIAEKMANGESLDGVNEDVKNVARQLGLDKAETLVDKGAADPKGLTLGKAVDAFTQGNVGALAGADSVLAAQALGEISDLVSSVDHKVRGIFKAKTIRASIGTPVEAKTIEAATIVLPPQKR